MLCCAEMQSTKIKQGFNIRHKTNNASSTVIEKHNSAETNENLDHNPKYINYLLAKKNQT